MNVVWGNSCCTSAAIATKAHIAYGLKDKQQRKIPRIRASAERIALERITKRA